MLSVRRPALGLGGLGLVLCVGASAAVGLGPAPVRAALPPPPPAVTRPTVVETWGGKSTLFHATHTTGTLSVEPVADAADGWALRMTLPARPGTGPGAGIEIASNATYRYGTFGSRLKAADCTGQGRVGVVTGTFTYSTDHADRNGNGLQDNDEIDFEWLCGQPDVVWMTIWTDYDEPTDTPHKISRAVDLGTGEVLYNCYLLSWRGRCRPSLPGENEPATVTPVPGYDSGRAFRSYRFDWQPDRVIFSVADDDARVLLWDYRGPRARIPQKAARFMQNVWHTLGWDPFDGPSHDLPVVDTSAWIDSTTVPRHQVSPWPADDLPRSSRVTGRSMLRRCDIGGACSSGCPTC